MGNVEVVFGGNWVEKVCRLMAHVRVSGRGWAHHEQIWVDGQFFFLPMKF